MIDDNTNESQSFAKYILIGLLTAIFVWAAYLNYAAFYEITKSPVWAVMGLFTLDFAAVIWLFTAFLVARGSGQRFVAITASAITGLLVAACSGLKIYMMAHDEVVGEGASLAMQIVLIAATVLNLAAAWMFKFQDPDMQARADMQRMEDRLAAKGRARLQQKLDARADELADDAAEQVYNRVANRFTGHTGHAVERKVNGHSFDGGPRSGLADAENLRRMKMKIEESEEEATAALQTERQSRWNSKDAGND